jgi:regulatory protein
MLQIRKITKRIATQRLENMCVRGEHCRYELQEKLRTWGIFPVDAEAILESLESRRFFDDHRFAAAFVRDKLLYNKWGQLKIIIGLKAKRIDPDIIQEAIDEIDPDEYSRIAREFLTAKAKTIKQGYTYEGRTKLYRAGLSRGFASQIVAPIVKDPSTWGYEQG